jgi:hypothetical protein
VRPMSHCYHKKRSSITMPRCKYYWLSTGKRWTNRLLSRLIIMAWVFLALKMNPFLSDHCCKKTQKIAQVPGKATYDQRNQKPCKHREAKEPQPFSDLTSQRWRASAHSSRTVDRTQLIAHS